ncbi:Gmad2 immunoglobulin-like domain-containing protein [Flaviaesturariibacter amylovorans]|uniref:Bacterial spore germination immunoglobulin-like domain-containing protein n=1 Tax=Flaviaesturariibacter amylovorans TaxID=1084520 RepID=A0ABP8GWW9_9BACT
MRLPVLLSATILYACSGPAAPGTPLSDTPTVAPAEAGTGPSPASPQKVSTPDSSGLIVITQPRAGDTLSGTVLITGKARGPWYFEAEFPVRLTDPAGRVIAQGGARAEGEWMTTNFVPFSARLRVPKGAPRAARLVLEKANASGLPEHADSIVLPVFLAVVE